MFTNPFSFVKPPSSSVKSLVALLLLLALILCGCAHQTIRPPPEELEAGIVLVPAAPKSGFNFPYLLKMPPQLSNSSPVYLLVEPNNSGHVSENLEDHLAAAVGLAKSGVGFDVARRLGVPLLMPVFPRSRELYTHSLNRRTLVTADQKLRRVDLQLLAMVVDARTRLAQQQIQTQERFLLTGFSASGAFVNRFTALHPESVQAVAAGAVNGMLILPMDRIGATTLAFPLGVADLPALAHRPFQVDEWKRVPQFIYMGAHDTNDAVKFDDAYTESERKIIYAHLGEPMQPDRWERCPSFYRKAGATVTFKTYPGVGHGTNGRMHAEIAEFCRQAGLSGR